MFVFQLTITLNREGWISIRIEQIKYIVDVYESHSITNTAEKFHISRQVVSGAISAMEKELDVTLLHRDHNKVSFTPIGELFTQKAQLVIAAYEDMMEILTPLSPKSVSYTHLVIRAVIAHISMNDKIILHCDLDVIGRF